MCRSIRVLHDFDPPTTDDEIHAAALQFVRKVSGLQKPSRDDEAAFQRAVLAVTRETRLLLGALSRRETPRTREGEREKAKNRWERRVERMRAP